MSDEQEVSRHYCHHCEKEVEQESTATVIMTGKVINDELDDIDSHTLIFHDNCFIEIAGEEYYPAAVCKKDEEATDEKEVSQEKTTDDAEDDTPF